MAAGVRASEPRVLVCLGALLARWVAAGLEAVVIGEVHENITLRCGNILGPRGLITWYRNDSEPVFLLSSNSSLPPAQPRFSLVNASSLHMEALSLQDEGNYTCWEVLNETRWFQVWLQVATPPPSAPQCWAELSPGLFTLQLSCRWAGGYPDPDLLWTEEPGGVVMGTSKLGVEMLNQPQLLDGKKFKCVGSHIVGPELGASCVVQIRSPSLLSEPMKTCFVGGNVTLTCEVSGAYPPAKILWLSNLTQPEVIIQPSSHHLITQSGQSSTLTIRNCSQDLDEGYYVCRAENPVGVREVDIWLSVKEPVNIGGIVGTIVSLLLLGLAIISGLLLYYSPVFCWKVGSTFRRQDMGDVMVLVDSEEEEVEEEEDAAEEEEEEASERDESPKEVTKYGHIHRVTALVNGNVDRMANGLQALQDDSSEQQSDIIQEEDRPV
ncbi:V-set and immunoglobulin domain-containing protein 10 isoform X3 [Tursiops truncatus]|uniref:V-set and immunoglobulin domain-containing protein 10 isoform X3 n=1 Tax=Tursiops truncatus TaxID=9739 RepID=UPI0009514625|nr:V-set and immunoglobulin domain-containing protein 10 isoform X3 [Tursiops truncatus]